MFSMFSRSKKKKHKTKLTKEQIKEFKEGFKLFDIDNDGAISSKELGQIMRTLGLNPTEAEIREMIAMADENNNGNVELEEFLKLMEMGISGSFDAQIELHRLFKIFDKDGDGFISCDELRDVMTSLGEKMTDEEVNEMMKEADLDGDGQVNYAEFVRMMCI